MTALPRRVSTAVVAALAIGVLTAAPAASADTDFTYDAVTLTGGVTGVKIYNWVAGSTSCPTALVIPATLGGSPVVAIAPAAFADKTCLSGSGATKSVTVPASVKQIGTGAFATNAGLTRVTFAGALDSLPSQAFAGDTSLAQIIFQGNGPIAAADTFAGVSGALVFYRSGTQLRTGPSTLTAWPPSYSTFTTYVLPEVGVAGLLAGVSRKRVYFFPTVASTSVGTAYVRVFAKVRKSGKTRTVLICRAQKPIVTAGAPTTLECSSRAARTLVRKRATTFTVRAYLTQVGSNFTSAEATDTVRVKRRR